MRTKYPLLDLARWLIFAATPFVVGQYLFDRGIPFGMGVIAVIGTIIISSPLILLPIANLNNPWSWLLSGTPAPYLLTRGIAVTMAFWTAITITGFKVNPNSFSEANMPKIMLVILITLGYIWITLLQRDWARSQLGVYISWLLFLFGVSSMSMQIHRYITQFEIVPTDLIDTVPALLAAGVLTILSVFRKPETE